MAVFQLEQMTWKDVEQLDKKNTVLFLPISPIEEHGPHLPLGTDLICARDIAAEAACIATRTNPRIQVVLGPAIPLGCAPATADFPGTISLRADTLKGVITDVCQAMAFHGFTYMLICNHHMDPEHMKAILGALEALNASLPVRIIETCSRYFRQQPEVMRDIQKHVPDLDLRLEMHADVKETSYILYRHTELCAGHYKQLPDQTDKVREGLAKRLPTFRQMGAEAGYIGSPGRASAQIGRLYFEDFSKKVAQMALELLTGAQKPGSTPGG